MIIIMVIPPNPRIIDNYDPPKVTFFDLFRGYPGKPVFKGNIDNCSFLSITPLLSVLGVKKGRFYRAKSDFLPVCPGNAVFR